MNAFSLNLRLFSFENDFSLRGIYYFLTIQQHYLHLFGGYLLPFKPYFEPLAHSLFVFLILLLKKR